MDADRDLDRFAGLALACVRREYPNALAHVLDGDRDVRTPRQLHPAFHGCFDWHSAVHGHWLLARAARLRPAGRAAGACRGALARSLTAANVAGEVAYLEAEGRGGFERPYGLAWLLTLGLELREWAAAAPRDADVAGWAAALLPLERLAARRLRAWVSKLTHPVRCGEHGQSAFAMGLALDWARVAGAGDVEETLAARARDFHLADREGPLAYEPSGHDFLSPCLAEADLMRRVLPADELSGWLAAFLPTIPVDGGSLWLSPARVADPADGKLAHLDGLNLSRAWMLEGVAAALPAGDVRAGALRVSAALHREAGLGAVTGDHYAGGHWLGSFAAYLITGRGLAQERAQTPGW